MKKRLLSIVLALGLISVLPVQAQYYGQLGLGASLNGGSVTTDNVRSGYKNTPAYSFAGGYEIPLALTNVRVEGEYLRIRPNAKHGSDSSFDGLMANGYVEVPLIPIIDPYIGAGIGMTRFDHNNSLALQGIMGLEYELPFLPLTIGGEYRYLKVNETGGKREDISKFHSNIFMFKMRYTF